MLAIPKQPSMKLPCLLAQCLYYLCTRGNSLLARKGIPKLANIALPSYASTYKLPKNY
jgi:hypothetical protein